MRTACLGCGGARGGRRRKRRRNKGARGPPPLSREVDERKGQVNRDKEPGGRLKCQVEGGERKWPVERKKMSEKPVTSLPVRKGGG